MWLWESAAETEANVIRMLRNLEAKALELWSIWTLDFGVMSKSVTHVQELGQEKDDHNGMDLKE